jgi:hypothetical protein
MTTDFGDVLIEYGYAMPRRLPDGRWLALQRMLYTTGLFLIEDGDWAGWRCRWCYEHTGEALKALLLWDGAGDDPPGDWVKQKGRDSHGIPVDRLNPEVFNPKEV